MKEALILALALVLAGASATGGYWYGRHERLAAEGPPLIQWSKPFPAESALLPALPAPPVFPPPPALPPAPAAPPAPPAISTPRLPADHPANAFPVYTAFLDAVFKGDRREALRHLSEDFLESGAFAEFDFGVKRPKSPDR